MQSINSITPQKNPAFGMSVKFNNDGIKYFNKVFEKNPSIGDEFLKRQASNKASNIYVGSKDVKVGINGAKWRVVGSIWSPKKNSAPIEEMFLTRNASLLRRQAHKTIIREGEPLSEKYGAAGKKLAIAEEIANYMSFKSENKAPSIMDKIKSLFKNN